MKACPEPSRRVLLSGNEAVARGAYEYGVQVATGYPGTPSSEILENVATYEEIYSEWSVNEKVAMDVAIGASYAGKRVLVAMKSVGMNVAADSFFYAVYTGVRGGLVIVVADDPGMFSSQNEQDNRQYGRFAKMPVLEPSDSQEMKDFVGAGLELSEAWDTLVLLRTVMRISHSASPVELGERKADDTVPTPPLKRDPHRLVCTCVWAKHQHPVIEARQRRGGGHPGGAAGPRLRPGGGLWIGRNPGRIPRRFLTPSAATESRRGFGDDPRDARGTAPTGVPGTVTCRYRCTSRCPGAPLPTGGRPGRSHRRAGHQSADGSARGAGRTGGRCSGGGRFLSHSSWGQE